MPAGAADEGFGDEIPDREGIRIAVITERIEFVVLLAVFDPDLLVTHRPDRAQTLVERDVVRRELAGEASVAGEVIIVVADHHGDLNARSGRPQLIEDRLMRPDDMVEPVEAGHEREFPESEGISD